MDWEDEKHLHVFCFHMYRLCWHKGKNMLNNISVIDHLCWIYWSDFFWQQNYTCTSLHYLLLQTTEVWYLIILLQIKTQNQMISYIKYVKTLPNCFIQ
jgi:hypothetical protein